MITVASADQCVEKYGGQILGLRVQQVTDAAHIASGAAVSFARGLNDTPKMLALLLATKVLDIRFGAMVIVVAMAIGGLLNARRVAQTMGRGISRMNDDQALSANLVTAFLVIVASRLGMPVSTTPGQRRRHRRHRPAQWVGQPQDDLRHPGLVAHDHADRRGLGRGDGRDIASARLTRERTVTLRTTSQGGPFRMNTRQDCSWASPQTSVKVHLFVVFPYHATGPVTAGPARVSTVGQRGGD